MIDKKFANLLSLALVALSVVLWFFLVPLKYESGGFINVTSEATYLQGAFGLETTILGVNVQILEFSFLNLIPLVLMVVAGLGVLAAFLKPKDLDSNGLKIGVILLTLVSLVLLMLVKTFLVPTTEGSFDEHALTFQAFIIPALLLLTIVLQVLKKAK